MSDRSMIGLLGGTFDPIHFGHLRFAEEVAEALELEDLRLIPAGRPPHRPPPVAPARHRLAMARLASAGHPVLRVDPREAESTAISYTIDTLSAIRREAGDRPVCLLMGADAFAGLASWRQWQEFPALCHIVVATRPGHSAPAHLPPLVKEIWGERFVADPRSLSSRPCGLIAYREITALDISASRIRTLLRERRSVRYLLPDAVLEYIEQHALYRDDTALDIE